MEELKTRIMAGIHELEKIRRQYATDSIDYTLLGGKVQGLYLVLRWMEEMQESQQMTDSKRGFSGMSKSIRVDDLIEVLMDSRIRYDDVITPKQNGDLVIERDGEGIGFIMMNEEMVNEERLEVLIKSEEITTID